MAQQLVPTPSFDPLFPLASDLDCPSDTLRVSSPEVRALPATAHRRRKKCEPHLFVSQSPAAVCCVVLFRDPYPVSLLLCSRLSVCVSCWRVHVCCLLPVRPLRAFVLAPSLYPSVFLPQPVHPRCLSNASSQGSTPSAASRFARHADANAHMSTVKEEPLCLGDEAVVTPSTVNALPWRDTSLSLDGIDFGRLPSIDSLAALNLPAGSGLLDTLSIPRRTPSVSRVLSAPAVPASRAGATPSFVDRLIMDETEHNGLAVASHLAATSSVVVGPSVVVGLAPPSHQATDAVSGRRAGGRAKPDAVVTASSRAPPSRALTRRHRRPRSLSVHEVAAPAMPVSVQPARNGPVLPLPASGLSATGPAAAAALSRSAVRARTPPPPQHHHHHHLHHSRAAVPTPPEPVSAETGTGTVPSVVHEAAAVGTGTGAGAILVDATASPAQFIVGGCASDSAGGASAGGASATVAAAVAVASGIPGYAGGAMSTHTPRAGPRRQRSTRSRRAVKRPHTSCAGASASVYNNTGCEGGATCSDDAGWSAASDASTGSTSSRCAVTARQARPSRVRTRVNRRAREACAPSATAMVVVSPSDKPSGPQGSAHDNTHDANDDEECFAGLSPAEAKAKRRALRLKRNRESAFRSRLRRKAQNEKMITELKELRVETDDQRKDIVALQRHAMALFSELGRLRGLLIQRGCPENDMRVASAMDATLDLTQPLPPTISAAASTSAASLLFGGIGGAEEAFGGRACVEYDDNASAGYRHAKRQRRATAQLGRAGVTMMVVMFAFAVCLFNVTDLVHHNAMPTGFAPSAAGSSSATTSSGRVLMSASASASASPPAGAIYAVGAPSSTSAPGYHTAAAAIAAAHGTTAPTAAASVDAVPTLMGTRLWSPSSFATLVLHLLGIPHLAEVVVVNLVVAAMAACTAMYLIGRWSAGVIFTRPSYYAANGSDLPTSAFGVEDMAVVPPKDLLCDDETEAETETETRGDNQDDGGDGDGQAGVDDCEEEQHSSVEGEHIEGDSHVGNSVTTTSTAGSGTFTVNGRTYRRSAMGKLVRLDANGNVMQHPTPRPTSGSVSFPQPPSSPCIAFPKPPASAPAAGHSDDALVSDWLQAGDISTWCPVAPPLPRAASTTDLAFLVEKVYGSAYSGDGDGDDASDGRKTDSSSTTTATATRPRSDDRVAVDATPSVVGAGPTPLVHPATPLQPSLQPSPRLPSSGWAGGEEGTTATSVADCPSCGMPGDLAFDKSHPATCAMCGSTLSRSMQFLVGLRAADHNNAHKSRGFTHSGTMGGTCGAFDGGSYRCRAGSDPGANSQWLSASGGGGGGGACMSSQHHVATVY